MSNQSIIPIVQADSFLGNLFAKMTVGSAVDSTGTGSGTWHTFTTVVPPQVSARRALSQDLLFRARGVRTFLPFQNGTSGQKVLPANATLAQVIAAEQAFDSYAVRIARAHAVSTYLPIVNGSPVSPMVASEADITAAIDSEYRLSRAAGVIVTELAAARETAVAERAASLAAQRATIAAVQRAALRAEAAQAAARRGAQLAAEAAARRGAQLAAEAAAASMRPAPPQYHATPFEEEDFDAWDA